MRLFLVTLALAVAALSSCGSASSSASCCVNGSYYQCPSADAAQSCTSSCSRDSSKDNTCT